MAMELRHIIFALLLFTGYISGELASHKREQNGGSVIGDILTDFISYISFSGESGNPFTFIDNDDQGEFDGLDTKAFTEKEIQDYRQIFQFARGWFHEDTAFADILDDNSFPTDFGLGNGADINSILAGLTDNDKLRQAVEDDIAKRFLKYMNKFIEVDVDDMETDDEQEEHQPIEYNDNEQVGGWEGCRRDYSALAEPFTNGLLHLVGKSVLEDILPIENVTCEDLCNYLCNRFLDFTTTQCAAATRAACVNDDTKATTIDIVFNYYIPLRNATRWQWAMLDASGKVPPAISLGQLHWSGSYQKCQEISVNYTYTEDNITEVRMFDAQWYRVPFKPPPFQNRSVSLLYVVCVPGTCEMEHVRRYLLETNLLTQVLLNRILDWEIDMTKMFSGTYEKLDEDVPPLVFALIVCITLTIIAVIATNYEILGIREKIMKKRLQEMEKSVRSNTVETSPSGRPYDTKSEIDNANTRPKFDIEIPDNYLPVHASDYRRFSIVSDNSENSNNSNATREKPEFARSISAQSTKALVDEDEISISPADEKPTIWERLEVAFTGFSNYTNLHRLTRTRRKEGYIPTLDSVRFFSLAWAFLGFTWLFGPVLAEVWISANLLWALKTYPQKWMFQPILNFHFCSDSFFLISGILVSYRWLRRYGSRKEKMTWKSVVFFYLHRYWRYMPALILTLIFYTGTYKYISGGPFAAHRIADAGYCRSNWWTNLFMISNLVNTDKMCFSWCFYIPILFQLLIPAALVMVVVVWKPLWGYALLGGLFIIHIATTAGISANLQSGDFDPLRWFTDYFLTPWCRAGPFFIGMGYGIYMYKNKLKLNVPEWVIPLGWLVAMITITAVQYSTYSQFKEGGTRWSDDAIIMYNTFARSAWAVGVGWIILACTAGRGGFVGEFLNTPVFQPLSRIAYSVVLVYGMLIYGAAYSIQSPLVITAKKITHMFIANVVMEHIGALFVIVLFHYPISLGIERAITVKTKLDCIKAGKHPPIPKSLEKNGDDQSSVQFGTSLASLSSASNGIPNPTYASSSALRRLDSIDEGYEELAHRSKPQLVNRQGSITSL